MGVTRLDKIRNTTIWKTLGMEFTILDRISQKRLRYFGYTERMPTTRLPQLALYTQVHGNRPRGRPPKRWTECLLADLQRVKITSLANATHLAKIYTQVHGNRPRGRPPQKMDRVSTSRLAESQNNLTGQCYPSGKEEAGMAGDHEAYGTTQPDVGVRPKVR